MKIEELEKLNKELSKVQRLREVLKDLKIVGKIETKDNRSFSTNIGISNNISSNYRQTLIVKHELHEILPEEDYKAVIKFIQDIIETRINTTLKESNLEL